MYVLLYGVRYRVLCKRKEKGGKEKKKLESLTEEACTYVLVTHRGYSVRRRRRRIRREEEERRHGFVVVSKARTCRSDKGRRKEDNKGL